MIEFLIAAGLFILLIIVNPRDVIDWFLDDAPRIDRCANTEKCGFYWDGKIHEG